MTTNPEDFLQDAMRRKIEEVALKVFHEKGIRGVTMDEIAHLLTMSKRTLYQIFTDKEELLMACVKFDHKKEKDYFDRVATSTSNVLEQILMIFEQRLNKLSQINPNFFLDAEKYPKLRSYFKQEEAENEEKTADFFNKGIRQGVFREGINWHIAYKALASLVDLTFKTYIYGNSNPRDIIYSTVLVYLRGMTTIKGNQQMDDFFNRHKMLDQQDS